MNDAIGGNPSGIGHPVRRKEDLRLLRGQGRYADDVPLANLAHAVMVRSPHAHARIMGIDMAAAKHAPGVLAVLTGADYLADGLRPLPHNPCVFPPPDVPVQLLSLPVETPHYPMPADKVRFVGEPVACVIADTIAHAKDAAEHVSVVWEPLPAVTDVTAAMRPGAPLLWDIAPRNRCVELEAGDAIATDNAFARADHVVRLRTQVQRVTGVPMESRTAIGDYDSGSAIFTLYAGTGRGVTDQQIQLAAILGVAPEHVRCVCHEMGGNFGTRNSFFAEYALLPWAARRIGQPVKWVCERQEAFLTDYQGRDLLVEAELALDRHGNFLAVRSINTSNIGAHTVSFVPLRKGMGLMTGVYRVPAAHVIGRGFLTNTVPTTPYRSAGRPEAIFVIERLVDLAARQCGFDPVELRRRNMVPPEAQPYANPVGLVYDSGCYRDAMERVLALADHAGFAARKAEALVRGRRRGFGVANYIEITSGNPRERAEITFAPGERVELVMGTMSSGQGHETSFAQLVTELLGVPLERIDYVAHDTDRVVGGGGSHSGRSMKMAAIVVPQAAEAIIEKGRRIAAHMLEADVADIDFDHGVFSVAGTDRTIGIFAVAQAAVEHPDLPPDLKGPLGAVADETVRVPSFPYGAQICEVEVDPETGEVALMQYAAIDDVGRAVNPLIVEGQTHGGIAQGVGQALWEHACYDPATGQMLAATFMDYAMPRADLLPSFATLLSEVPAPSNPLGVRSGGEGGTTPALAVVVNAIVDALGELGVRHVEMPATPERVWRTIVAGRADQTNGPQKTRP
ncbi:MAG TPA: xanthine dehydrogenase family protein molybdopterin-binding subunit [Acetobacteraceae bacterium]|nr:xanthine dehydrogenase family protein molybdopterin-binding subunit [Acetobacteraceae bacterium]